MRRNLQERAELRTAAKDVLARIQPAPIRAVCYVLFSEGLIASMAQAETDRVTSILRDAREQGEVPWAWVIQKDRPIEKPVKWRDPAAYVQTVIRLYRKDKQRAQTRRVLVISEKATVQGTLQPVLDELEVSYCYIGGSSSATRVHDVKQMVDPERPLLILYLGDFDPSGMYMSEKDFPRRLARYLCEVVPSKYQARDWSPAHVRSLLRAQNVEFRRLAIVKGDTQRIRNLSFPAADKGPQYRADGTRESKGDPNYPWFVANYGDTCWELDAMNPNDLREKLRRAIAAEIDQTIWDRYVELEAEEREAITECVAELEQTEWPRP